MTLLDAGDAAWPNLALLPGGFEIVLGYIGESGHATRITPLSEVQDARDAGYLWAPIWVPAQGVMSADTGLDAANKALVAIQAYNVPAWMPVFLDIEFSSYSASKTGAKAARDAFRNRMAQAGRINGLAYQPYAAGYDWVTHPNDIKPSVLGAGVVGVQYEFAGSWDYSVFAPALFTAPTPPDPSNNDEDDMDQSTFNDLMDSYLQRAAGTPDHGFRLAMDSYFSTRIPDADHPTAGSISERLANRIYNVFDDPTDARPDSLAHITSKLNKIVPSGVESVQTMATAELAPAPDFDTPQNYGPIAGILADELRKRGSIVPTHVVSEALSATLSPAASDDTAEDAPARLVPDQAHEDGTDCTGQCGK